MMHLLYDRSNNSMKWCSISKILELIQTFDVHHGDKRFWFVAIAFH